MKLSLNGIWNGQGISPEGKTIDFDGRIPGCVHADLLRNGTIKDPFWRDNALECRWIERWNWVYEKEFSIDEAFQDARLEFDGLDTYCQIYLNGLEIGRTDNMFISHSIPAEGLRKGKNTLRLVFKSPIAETNGLPPRPAAFTSERLYTRRIQCTYSWDWVDRFVTMGAWGDVCLHVVERREIKDLHHEVRALDAFGALLRCHVDFDGGGSDCFCRLSLTSPEGDCVFSKRRRIVEDGLTEWIDVENPRLWWPNGYGDQPLYVLCAQVETEDGTVLHEKTMNVGIRTFRIVQQKDRRGTESFNKCLAIKNGPHVSGKNAFWDRNNDDEFSSFTLLVNNMPIFCKGANWVPCEPFPSEETPEKIERILTLARDAHVNMIRVWGGGIFEHDVFYDTCDKLGLLVTQDFLMACGRYPEEDEAFLAQLRKEAAWACKKLRNHPCLMWWTGDNENGMNGDEDMLDYGGRRSALRAIGPVLETMDPNRPFLPSSPYGGRPYGSITRGTTHNTNYIGEWFSYIRFNDMADYRPYFEKYLSRFCAEEPIMGFDTPSSLRRFMTEQDIYGDDDAMLRFHTKNNPSSVFREFQIYDYLCAIAEKLFGAGNCAEDRVLKRQYVQYEWIRLTMEQYRREKWFSSGLIYWMLNDCWPANGWAIIDYYARPKAAWYAMRRSCQPIIASISKKDGKYCLHVCCDGQYKAEGQARMFIQPFMRGEPLWERTIQFRLEANTSQVVLETEIPQQTEEAFLMAEISGEGFSDRTWFFESRPQDCRFPGEQPQVIEHGDDFVTLRANCYIHAVELDGDCFFDDNFFSLLPGEERTIHFKRERKTSIRIRSLNSSAPSVIIP